MTTTTENLCPTCGRPTKPVAGAWPCELCEGLCTEPRRCAVCEAPTCGRAARALVAGDRALAMLREPKVEA